MEVNTIAKYLEKLDREITKTNSLMNETKHLLFTLRDIEKHVSKLEALATKDERIREALKNELKDRDLPIKIKTLEKQLLELQRFLKESEEPTLKLDVLLETLRTRAEYQFDDSEKMKAFLLKALKELKEKQIKFRPRILGIMNLSELKTVGTFKDSWLILPTRKLSKLLSAIEKEPQREYVYAGENIKITQSRNKLSIIANTETLQLLDTLAKMNGAKILM